MEFEEKDLVATATPDILQEIARAMALCREYYHSDYGDTARRNAILRELFGSIGENVAIDTPFYCDHGKNISIGSNVIIGMNCTFVDNAPIVIGDNVMIASNVQLYTAAHPVAAKERFVEGWREKGTVFFRTYARPIVIEDGAWIGGGVILLPGVTVGRNSVIGAGSVVTRSIPADCVAVGSPCKVIRTIEN